MEKDRLQKGLLPRHIRMMAIGGMIGAGMFKGSGDTLSLAGPGVIFAYLFGGALLLVVMGALAEMAGVYPKADMRYLIEKAFGRQAAFIVGWLYWINWVLVMAVEIVAAGSFLQYWFQSAPLWLLSFIVALCVLIVNLANVKYYGEVEFWLSGVKVMALVLFIILGGTLLFGGFSGGPTPPLKNFMDNGGFLPKGWAGVFSSLLVVMFSYGGSELIGLTISETKNAEQVLPRVIRGVIGRVALFYTLPLLIISGLVPWNHILQGGSPFVQVLAAVGLKGAAHIMNFVMLTAVFSAANSGMYATSRMLYSLAQGGEAPRIFTRVSKHGVPVYGLVVSAVSLFVGVLAAYLTPANVFNYLMGIPGFTVMLVWIGIVFAQLKLRTQYPSQPSYKLRLFPYTSLFTGISLIAIFISVLLNGQNVVSSIICLAVMAILFVSARIKQKSLAGQSQGTVTERRRQA
ncbi:amino acid permease [Aneurinibacillus sp. Ricciae_BoGa-3]|uniref:amino acid permease n=1 Tax=Aneurinibacillus sp. Ricciae_BoGa-3 TaxID=3022697 RepID=UPI00233FF185|nr:amino acid permease [Aneurinibacillus sp. Ricciae_BoGa-3]WCK55550.1 amino acid permease [Aneurinibacillus sp. Ricciae_BoGa-3]